MCPLASVKCFRVHVLLDVFHGGKTFSAKGTHVLFLVVGQVSVHVKAEPFFQHHAAANGAGGLLFC